MTENISETSLRKMPVAIFLISVLPVVLVILFPQLFDRVVAPAPYLVFHNISEFFSIIVSLSIFGVGWFTFEQSRDRHSLLLSTAFLAIGLLDFMHALSNAAMPHFITANSSNKSTQFWIAARLFQGVTMLGCAYAYSGDRTLRPSKLPLLAAALFFPALVFTGIIFFPHMVPDTFVPGTGLTPFKRFSEYLAAGLLCAALVVYQRSATRANDHAVGFYQAALIVAIMGEINFAVYTRVFDSFNILGHVYKVVAFILFYRGIFIASVREPYGRLAEVSVSRDELSKEVEERKRAEEALRESEERFRLFMDNSPTISWVKDEEGRYVYLSLAYEHRFGVRLADWRGRTDAELCPSSGFCSNDLAVLAYDQPMQVVEETLNPDGSSCYWFNTKFPFCDAAGRRYVAGIGLDITERKQAEESLRNREHRYRSFIELTSQFAWVTDASGQVVEDIPALRKFTGQTYEEAKGTGWSAALHPDDLRHTLEVWDRAVASRSPYEVEYRMRRHDGVYRLLHARGVPVLNEQGMVMEWVGTCIDITDRKLAEETLREAHDELVKMLEERTRDLREKEVLLKEIHHRVKNNLQVISSLVGLQADGTRDETVREVLKDVTDRVRSMALVHEKLYQSANLACIDFAEYSRGLLSYLWRAHGGSSIKLTLDLEPVSLPVDTAVPLGLILNELAGNALKHAFQGREEGEVIVSLQSSEEGLVTLCVADNGIGLPEGLDWRRANSLGLRLVQMLAGQIGASVEVESRGEGTRFEVSFGL